MLTKEKLQKQLDDIQVQLNELKETKEWPKPREDFYCLAVNGIIKIRHSESYYIKDIMDRGWYKTEDDARWADGVRMANTYLRGCNNGYEFVAGRDNWYIFYNNSIKDIDKSYDGLHFFDNLIYFKTSKRAQKAIDHMPSKLKKYLMPRPLDE